VTPFATLTGIAAPIPIANIDTDMLVPARFIKTVTRAGLAKALFYNARFDADGAERAEFVLNQAPWRNASIVVALDNFGCGSSREHAPWALLDYGIRCVIAPSFADIFFNNCCKNGILPITLPRVQVDILLDDVGAPVSATLTVDLNAQTIRRANGAILPFDIAPERRHRLLLGLDDIGHTLTLTDQIAAHEQRTRAQSPWLATTGLEPWRGDDS